MMVHAPSHGNECNLLFIVIVYLKKMGGRYRAHAVLRMLEAHPRDDETIYISTLVWKK